MDKMQEILNSPEAMDKVLSLAQSIMGNSSAPEEKNDLMSTLGNIDPKVIQTVSSVISEYNSTDDRRFQLLNALRPYMRAGEDTHIDKAMQIMRLSRVIRHALKNGFGGDLNV